MMLRLAKTVLKGAVFGWITTHAIDRGKSAAYEAAARKIAARMGVSLSRRDAKTWGLAMQQVLGVASGLVYAAVTSRQKPKVSARHRARSKAA